MIQKISRIQKHRLFRDFQWPGDLQEFARYNVIYGWNGSGKTTLSSIFRAVEKSQSIEGTVEFALEDGSKVSGTELAKKAAPQIRVFNRDVVNETVQGFETGVGLIYYLGKDIQKQQEVERLEKELESEKIKAQDARSSTSQAEKEMERFLTGEAKSIKDALRGGDASFATYNKAKLKSSFEALIPADSGPRMLSDAEKDVLSNKMTASAKEQIPKLRFRGSDLLPALSEIEALLSFSVVSETLDELKNDRAVASWVQQGLALHSGDRNSTHCRFCENEISAERRNKLEGHFNDQFASFQRQCAKIASDLQARQTQLSGLSFPDEARFYEHLRQEFCQGRDAAKAWMEKAEAYLKALEGAVDRKVGQPFQQLSLSEEEKSARPDLSELERALAQVNAVINTHNEQASNLSAERREATEELEKALAAERLGDYKRLQEKHTKATKQEQGANARVKELQGQIDERKNDLRNYRTPAEELNRELSHYLGRSELQFDVLDTGYQPKRGNEIAQDLSEGEKTAIAFLYFLKSLSNENFDLKKSIVVIDDPVSSLDANALFAAFGYMKARTVNAGQLLILTHNYSFFRQVKNWFSHMKDQRSKKIEKRPARFYSLRAVVNAAGQSSTGLTALDPFLWVYESEYHYLFRQVVETANTATTGASLEIYYGMPNIARRLLETFLAFRYPQHSQGLKDLLDQVQFSEESKVRILRLLHTYSHAEGIPEPPADPSGLAETPKVLGEMLNLIRTVDPEHHAGMIELINQMPATESP